MTHAYSEEIFLNGLGHAQLRIDGTGIYTCEVWEPAYSIVNWAVVALAGGLGGVVGFLLSR